MTPPTATRCAVVALIGAPNAGKSTLVNRLVGAKVAIVTHKVQTTRAPLRGVALRGDCQLILVDTPGVFAPRRRLDRAMVRAAWASAEDADDVVHLVDAAAEGRVAAGRGTPADRRASEDSHAIAAALQSRGRPALLALNKVDAMPRPALLGVAQAFAAAAPYQAVFMIAAATGDGVEDLAAALCARAPAGPWLYPEDQAADAPARVLCAEITREKLMLRLHQELPYDATVETENWEERKDGSVRIDQSVFVARESQRRMAIGDDAQAIKAIGEAARHEIEAVLGRRAHLFLHVKVREGWDEERARFRALGLDFDA